MKVSLTYNNVNRKGSLQTLIEHRPESALFRIIQHLLQERQDTLDKTWLINYQNYESRTQLLMEAY